MFLNVHDLPQHVAEQELAGNAVIVVDVLRASTTICQSLASGAREVVPFLEVEETISAAARGDREAIVLGGERGGMRIEGFDLGNSPAEFTPQAVAGRRVFITTTNGTRALQHARRARRVLIGAFVNLSAVVASVKDDVRVDILCAGTDGRETGEDILAAGAIVSRLAESPGPVRWLNDVARQARQEWESVLNRSAAASRSISEQLAIEFRETPGGRNLVEIGLESDLKACAQVDRLGIVPELEVSKWRIALP